MAVQGIKSTFERQTMEDPFLMISLCHSVTLREHTAITPDILLQCDSDFPAEKLKHSTGKIQCNISVSSFWTDSSTFQD